MPEHLSDGKFAPKEVTEPIEVKADKPRHPGYFQKGKPRHPKAGRKKGTPNKITREVKEWLALLVSKAEVQDGIEAKIARGDTVAFFRALEHVMGKPREQVQVDADVRHVFGWKDTA